MSEPFSVGPNVVPFRATDDLPALMLFRLIESLVETREYKRHWNDLIKKETIRPSSACSLRYSEFSKPIDQVQKALEAGSRTLGGRETTCSRSS